MKKFYFLFVLFASLFNLHPNTTPSIDPLSKIVITSNRAVCQKEKDQTKTFTFTYLDNVDVTFADQSNIKCNELEIEIDSTSIQKGLDPKQTTTEQINTKKDVPSRFRKITFKNNVLITRENRTIQANNAELFPEQKICKLFGNVKIKQNKKYAKDLPMETQCEQATLNMQTEQLTFLGNEQKPVNTTIQLGNHPGLLKKVKTKEEKKAERKALRKIQSKKR